MTKEELKKEAEKWLSITDNHLNDERTHFLSESEYAEQAYLAGAEPREKRIAELEKENAELKADNDARKFAMAMSEKVEKQLRDENAELKADNVEWEKASDKWKSVYEITNNQLTNAKEIIREFMKYEINEYDGSLEIHFEELKKQAEQFLKE